LISACPGWARCCWCWEQLSSSLRGAEGKRRLLFKKGRLQVLAGITRYLGLSKGAGSSPAALFSLPSILPVRYRAVAKGTDQSERPVELVELRTAQEDSLCARVCVASYDRLWSDRRGST